MKIYEEDIEKQSNEFKNELQKGITIAKKNNINFSKFKQEIFKHLTSENNEDQWTFDYESYLVGIARSKIFQTPTEWGKEYYYERWQMNKNKKNIINKNN